MKKQFLILATLTTIVFVSCSKEKIENPVLTQQSEEVTRPGSPNAPLTINPLSIGLLGRYEFNGTLKDTSGKLPDAWPVQGRVIFGTDRKGQANKAVRFNGAYGLDITKIPYTPATASVSFWVKDDVIEGPNWKVIMGSYYAFMFQQSQAGLFSSFNTFAGGNVQQVWSAPINSNWHHVAATRDNNSMKLYIDGVLIGTTPSPAVDFGTFLIHPYMLGYGAGSFWKGSMDDVRFYNRVLTPTEIGLLKNL